MKAKIRVLAVSIALTMAFNPSIVLAEGYDMVIAGLTDAVDEPATESEPPQSVEPEPAKAEPAKAEPAKAKPAKTKPAKKPKPEKPKPAKAEPEKIEPASDKDKDGEEKEKDKPAKAPKAQAPASDVSWPKRLTSFACCTLGGWPIATAKRTVYQTNSGKKDLVGTTTNPILVGPALALSFPYAVLGGFLEGIGYTVSNSWKGSAKEPFGKEAFSVEMDDTQAPADNNN